MLERPMALLSCMPVCAFDSLLAFDLFAAMTLRGLLSFTPQIGAPVPLSWPLTRAQPWLIVRTDRIGLLRRPFWNHTRFPGADVLLDVCQNCSAKGRAFFTSFIVFGEETICLLVRACAF